MGIVDYLSKDPIGEPWPESKLDEKFVVASIEQFHKALDCLNNRLTNTTNTIRNKNENILEHSELRNTLDEAQDTSSHGCYSICSVQKRTRLDRNENCQNLRFSNCERNTLSKISHRKKSVDTEINNQKNAEKERKFAKEQMEEKSKKTVKLMDREGRRDQKLEQITETTYQRTKTVQRGASENDWDSSDSDIAQVEWPKVDILNKRKDTGQPTSTSTRAESAKLMFFWDLVGSERTDRVTPQNMLELEATLDMTSPQRDIPKMNDSMIRRSLKGILQLIHRQTAEK